MKRKTREEKAITLIALIITIVVLLILAVVAINAVTGDGIIQHAVNAKEDYEKAQEKENGILAYYEQYLNAQNGSGPWKQTGDTIYMTSEKGEPVELKIGDRVEYDELSNGKKSHSISYTENGGSSSSDSQSLTTQDLEWRVLGLNNNGQLELISNQPVVKEGTDASGIYLNGENGYLNAVSILNRTCNELYGKGKGAASARSLNIDDVNKLAGIITEEHKKQVTNNYGNYWRFKYDATKTSKIAYSKLVSYNPETKVEEWSEYSDTKLSQINGHVSLIFKEPGKTVIDENNKEGIAKIKYTGLSYVISDKIKTRTQDGKLISDLLTKGLDYENEQENNTNVTQWLASNETVILENTAIYAKFGVYDITAGKISNLGLWNSYGAARQNDTALPFRPVVTLNSKAKIIGDTNGNRIPEVK